MKLTWFFLSSHFATWRKSHDKNLNILRTKRAFEVKSKAFFIIFQGFLIAKNCLGPESTSLMENFIFYAVIRSWWYNTKQISWLSDTWLDLYCLTVSQWETFPICMRQYLKFQCSLLVRVNLLTCFCWRI